MIPGLSFPATFGTSQQSHWELTSFFQPWGAAIEWGVWSAGRGTCHQTGGLGRGWKFSFWQDGKSKTDPSPGGIRTLGRYLKQGLGQIEARWTQEFGPGLPEHRGAQQNEGNIIYSQILGLDIFEGTLFGLSQCLSVQFFLQVYYLCKEIFINVCSIVCRQLKIIFLHWSMLSSVQQGLEAR